MLPNQVKFYNDKHENQYPLCGGLFVQILTTLSLNIFPIHIQTRYYEPCNSESE